MADEENNVDEEPKEEINEGEEEKKEEEPLLDSDGNPINPEDLKPKAPEAPLKIDMLRKSVKKLQRTYDGLSYAYTEIDLKEKEIDDLGTDIDNFTQILDFNVSTNKLPNINCVKNMPYLIRIDASVNEIKDMDVFNNPERFQYLQLLNLKTNKIHVLPEMQAVNLLQMDLSENKIKDCSQFKGLPNLKKLNLSTNRLENCIGLANCPKLEVLYLNNNRLTSIKGLDNLPVLRKLRLRTNKIETFDSVPNLPMLEKLAISENLIKKNVEFSKLKFPSLKRINIDGNPYFDESGANPKIEVLIQLEGLEIKFVNKEDAVVSVFDHGVLYGDGVFEGIRAYNGRVFRCKEHIDRLYDSAKAIALDIGMTKKEMTNALLDTLAINKLDDAYIRLVVTRGAGDLGLDPANCGKPTIFIIADKITIEVVTTSEILSTATDFKAALSISLDASKLL